VKIKGLVNIGIAWTFGVCGGAHLSVFHFRREKGRAADISAVAVATARPLDLNPQD